MLAYYLSYLLCWLHRKQFKKENFYILLKMGKQTSLHVRELVLKFHNEAKSLREIGAMVGRSHNTIKYVIEKYKKFSNLENRPKSGRPAKLNCTQIRSIVRKVKQIPTESAVRISENISECSGISVSASTVRRALHANGLYGRVPRKKPHISLINQRRRRDFAKKYENESNVFWSNVLFTDESKFEIFGGKKRLKFGDRKILNSISKTYYPQ